MELVFISGTLWLASIVIGTIIGSERKAGCASFALTVILGPIGLIIVLLLPYRLRTDDEIKQSSEYKKCPFCAEMIKHEAIVCRYCGRDLPTPEHEPKCEHELESEPEIYTPNTTSPEPETQQDTALGNYVFIAILIILAGIFFFGLYLSAGPPKTSTSNTKQHTLSRISWPAIARGIRSDFKDKVIGLEQLNEDTCWIIIDPALSNGSTVRLTEDVGEYIRRNSTGGGYIGKTPTVHAFRKGKHTAIARYYDNKYEGAIKIENWNPDQYNGKYRP